MTKQFTATVNVSLSEFEADDLIDEIKDRHLTDGEIDDLRDFIFRKYPEVPKEQIIQAETLEDVLKLDLFREALQKFTIPDLEKRLS